MISIDNLLQAPHSHAVLRDLLPLLGNLIHDQAEKVRLVVVKLLISVKQLKGIKFYHVVPVDHLLARLAAEGRRSDRIRGALASALTSLLLNSYFPQGEHVTGSMQIQRSLSLLTTSPRAAAVFYANVSSHLNVNAVCKLIAMLLKCLKVSVAASQKENQTNMLLKKLNRKDVSGVLSDDEMKRDLSSGRQTLTATNTSLMATIADTLCILWDSVSFPQQNAYDLHHYLMI